MTNVYVVHPALKKEGASLHREQEAYKLEEAVNLAAAIQLTVIQSEILPLTQIRPSTYIGKGHIERINAFIAERETPALLVVNAPLSAVQQRNLERALNCKVIDRTGLILEIFGARAQTKEGELQVELAALQYQKSRLVRSWTHLERQRGGLSFVGGPGESQIELDRRMIRERIAYLEKRLSKVQCTRAVQRKHRKKHYTTVALVGYTNAGKSTLFNRLTQSAVFAEDLLFATLDPTMRRLSLSKGQSIILSDTVGFISDLPHELVAAFRATLEEVLAADLIVHAQDISHETVGMQRLEVEKILKELGVSNDIPVINVWNKKDLLTEDQRTSLENKAQRQPNTLLISAQKDTSMHPLLRLIETTLAPQKIHKQVTFSVARGDIHVWLAQHSDILKEQWDEETCTLQLYITPQNWAKVHKRFGAVFVRG